MLYFHPKNAAKDQKDGDLLAANQLLPQQAFRKSALGALAQQTQSFGKSRIEQEGKIEIYIYIYIYIFLFFEGFKFCFMQCLKLWHMSSKCPQADDNL